MDRYTLMASKCKQLQEEWEPKVGDNIASEALGGGELIDRGIVVRKDYKKFILYTSNPGSYNPSFGAAIYLPTLEQLIEMLEGIEFRLLRFQGYGEKKEWHFGWQARFEFTESNNWRDMQLYGKTPQEALLKLLAYERWGLVWSDKKQAWGEGC